MSTQAISTQHLIFNVLPSEMIEEILSYVCKEKRFFFAFCSTCSVARRFAVDAIKEKYDKYEGSSPDFKAFKVMLFSLYGEDVSRGLSQLDLSKLQNFEQINQIVCRFSGLKKLTLPMKLQNPLTEEQIEVFADKTRNLVKADLSGCNYVTDRNIFSLLQHCDGLESLDLSLCKGITCKSVLPLVQRYPQLKTLCLLGKSPDKKEEIEFKPPLRGGTLTYGLYHDTCFLWFGLDQKTSAF